MSVSKHHSSKKISRYFGLHFDLHPRENDTCLGADITEEMIKTLLENVKPDYIQYDCKGHPGYTGYPTKIGWASPGIKKDSLAIWRKITKKYNIDLYVHYSGAWDEIAAKNYPEWTIVNPDGSHDTKILSFFSPYVDKIMIPQLKELIEKYDIDGAWIDGDSWAVKPDWSKKAIEEFQKTYNVKEIPLSPKDPYWKEWMEFQRKKYLEYVKKYVMAVHDIKPDFKITVNWLYSTISPLPVDINIDYLSGDVTPQNAIDRFRVEARYLASKEKTWDLMTWGFNLGEDNARLFKPITQMLQEAAIVISQGGGFQVYYKPTRSGWIDKWMIKALAKVSNFCNIRKDFSYKTRTVPQIAIIFSNTEHFSKLDEKGRIFGIVDKTHDAFKGMLHALLELHYSVDILDEYNIGRIMEYPLVILPEWKELSENSLKQLLSYVEKGGNLLITGAYSASLFKDYLGVKFLNEPQLEKNVYVPSQDVLGWIGGLWQNIEIETAECIGLKYYSIDLRKRGKCSASLNHLGKGTISAIYGPLGKIYFNWHIPAIREFIGNIIEKVFSPKVKVNAPPYLDVVLRKKDNKLLIHLINLSRKQTSPNYSLIDHIPPIGPINIKVKMSKTPRNIYIVPSNEELNYTSENNELKLNISKIKIHSIVVIEK
ncbi:MAG: alpha-L-fucosidase [Thermoproteales archaeon]|nr:alpha-L-fucosidase [Thermoproteales archaeon]